MKKLLRRCWNSEFGMPVVFVIAFALIVVWVLGSGCVGWKSATVKVAVEISGGSNDVVVTTETTLKPETGDISDVIDLDTPTPVITPVVIPRPPATNAPPATPPATQPPPEPDPGIPLVPEASGKWKPVGQDGKLVVILPSRYTAPLPPGPYTDREIDEKRLDPPKLAQYDSHVTRVHARAGSGGHEDDLRFTGVANGFREHHRHNAPGASWPGPVTLTAYFEAGATKTWVIVNPSGEQALQ